MDNNRIVAIRNGSEKAFEEVYHTYHQKLYAFFYKKTSSAAISEELVQTAFIKLWRFRAGLDPALSISVQLFRIAKTSVIDILRKEARNRLVLPGNEQLADIGPATEPEVMAVKMSTVRNALSQLPPMRRKIMEYRLEGFSNYEIAAHLSVSRKTIENHVNKAIRKLREHMDIPLLIILIALR